MDKQYFIYMTTNLLNGMKYIGYHCGYENDSYLGSGTYILKAIKQYGRKNFKREILEFCTSKGDAFEKEKYWIKYYNAVNDKMFYNFSEGGEKDSGWECANRWQKEHPEEAKIIHQKNIEKLQEWKKLHPEEVKNNIQARIDGAKNWKKEHPEEVQMIMEKVNLAKEKWQKEHPEEHQKQIDKWRQAGSITNSQKVKCITTGEIFESISAAARAYSCYGCKQENISAVLKGKRKSCGKKDNKKLEWELVNPS